MLRSKPPHRSVPNPTHSWGNLIQPRTPPTPTPLGVLDEHSVVISEKGEGQCWRGSPAAVKQGHRNQTKQESDCGAVLSGRGGAF